MSLLLVVVLLFFSSSCSVSSGQYYVSDDCSSVTQSPCNPLSVYAGNMSQYNNTIFYFIGTTNISYDIIMTAVKNVTLHGLDQSPSIVGIEELGATRIFVQYSDHVTISNLTIDHCRVEVDSSNSITIFNNAFISFRYIYITQFIVTTNAFDLKISSSVFSADSFGFLGYAVYIQYDPLPACSSELLHYSLILTDVTFTVQSQMILDMHH
uniref:Right handed beta helix domain-containing protein n=1 Tax=Amphimedon queenslandica TaxID=400682 RepID=A0A1X7TC44_AMPQE